MKKSFRNSVTKQSEEGKKILRLQTGVQAKRAAQEHVQYE